MMVYSNYNPSSRGDGDAPIQGNNSRHCNACTAYDRETYRISETPTM